MSDPKPVELLTESEKVPLLQAYTEGPIAMLDAVTAIVAAREITAEQAGREDNALHEMCYVSGSKALEAREAAARREALLEVKAMDLPARLRSWAAIADRTGMLVPMERAADRLDSLLAEPERDEESTDV